MKKNIFSVVTAWLFAAFLPVGFVQGQAVLQTYLSEDFSDELSSKYWNLETCTSISDQVGPIYFVDMEDEKWGGYIYDPKQEIISGGFTQSLNGVYELNSATFSTLQEAVQMISFDYLYTAKSYHKTRNFGLRVRQHGSEWDTLFTLRKAGANLPANTKGHFSVPLDARYNGKEMELGFFFYNEHQSDDKFALYIDNIRFDAYEAQPDISTEIISSYYAIGPVCDLKLSVKNEGGVAAREIRYAYKIGSKGETRSSSVTLEPELFQDEREVILPVDISDGKPGQNNKLRLWCTHVNGNEVASEGNDTLIYQFVYVDGDLVSQSYTPLVECFSSSTCNPCAIFNRYLNPALEELKKDGTVNAIKYQMNFPSSGDPYYFSACGTRFSYYEGTGVPTPMYNGKESMYSWSNNIPEIMSILNEKASRDNEQMAMISIFIRKAVAEQESGKMILSFDILPAIEVYASVYAVVTEKTTYENRGTNGESSFHYVAMDMPTGGNGIPIDFKPGKTESFSYEIDLNYTNMEEITDLEVVCFVQDRSKTIFQSVSADVAVGGLVSNDLPISESNFPDSAFRRYIAQNFDVSKNDSLSEEECAAVTEIRISDSGIVSLDGMQHFPNIKVLECQNNRIAELDLQPFNFLEQLNCRNNLLTELDLRQNRLLTNLDCSENQLTSLDLSLNSRITELVAEENRRKVEIDPQDYTFNLTELPGFSVSRASNWNGASLKGTILKFDSQTVTYSYDPNLPQTEGLPPHITFTLTTDVDIDIDIDTTIANKPEYRLDNTRIYAIGQVLYIENTNHPISVYTLSGSLVYNGYDRKIALPGRGIYIVRHRNQTKKILAL